MLNNGSLTEDDGFVDGRFGKDERSRDSNYQRGYRRGLEAREQNPIETRPYLKRVGRFNLSDDD